MGNSVLVVKNGIQREFKDIIGHQVGNGAIQILERSGNSTIIFSADEAYVRLDEEAAKDFEGKLDKMENPKAATPIKSGKNKH